MEANSNEQRIKKIAGHFAKIMHELGLDLNDENLKDTPMRFAKMTVNETCAGLFTEPPRMMSVTNEYPGNQIVLERKISFNSLCAHHWQNIVGYVHIAYIPAKKVLGLSKFHRTVMYFAAKPQIQERFTQEIGYFLQKILETQDVAVIVQADHYCCKVRGVKDLNSDTVTSFLGGVFYQSDVKMELFKLIKL